VRTSGNKQNAARLLEVDRKTLDRMINRHGISIQKSNAGVAHRSKTEDA
jgi:transcriptional regulator with GAF, ATPase, and Fis domain